MSTNLTKLGLSTLLCIPFLNATAAQEPLEESIAEELSLEGLYKLPFVSIATGTAVPLEKAPSVASLITAEDIKAMGALTLDEVLEAVPGLHVIPSTLSRLTPSYTFRGMYTGANPQVLFLLNGQRLISTTFAANIEHMAKMNVENISRIEVVRGPGSAIYGADAYSGVVNIITKRAKEINGANIGVRGGSHNTKNIWAQYGTVFENQWELALNLEYFSRDTDTSRVINSDTQSTFDTLFGSSASLAPGYLEDRFEATNLNIHFRNPNWQVSLDSYFKRDSGLGAGGAQALDHNGHDDYDMHLFTLAYVNKDWVKNWTFEGNLSYYYSKVTPQFDLFPPGSILPVGNDGNIFTPHNGAGCTTANIPGIGCITTFIDGYLGNPGGKSTIPQIEFTGHYNGIAKHAFRFNFGIKQEKMDAFATQNFGPGVLDSTTLGNNNNPAIVDVILTDLTDTQYIYAPKKDRTVRFLSLQDIWEIGIDWALTTGVRYDHYSDFGSTINPRVALVWTATDSLIAKLLYGEAFRAPSFSELYSQNNPVILGNKDLDPETIKTTELAIRYEMTPEITTGLSFYHYKAKDMIEFVANADGTSTAQNDKNLTGKGFEIEATWEPSKKLKVSANYAHQSTKNDRTDKQLEYVPKNLIYLDARWKFNPDWEISSQLNWIADRERADGDIRKDIDDYTLVNLTLRRSNLALGGGQKNWEFAATIKNLFDENAFEPSDGSIPDDYPLNERRFYAEVRYHLK